jgi:putrescine importer
MGRGHRSAGDLVKYGLLPLLGAAFTFYLWTNLSGNTFTIGLAWLAVGLVYLAVLTRMFTRQPTILHLEGDDEGNAA